MYFWKKKKRKKEKRKQTCLWKSFLRFWQQSDNANDLLHPLVTNSSAKCINWCQKMSFRSHKIYVSNSYGKSSVEGLRSNLMKLQWSLCSAICTDAMQYRFCTTAQDNSSSTVGMSMFKNSPVQDEFKISQGSWDLKSIRTYCQQLFEKTYISFDLLWFSFYCWENHFTAMYWKLSCKSNSNTLNFSSFFSQKATDPDEYPVICEVSPLLSYSGEVSVH